MSLLLACWVWQAWGHANHSQRFLLLPFWVKPGCEPNWLAALLEAGVDLTFGGRSRPVVTCGGVSRVVPTFPLLGNDPASSMQQATDEHAALHAMCQILSPASCSDFRARIHELLKVNGALALWASCSEIQHFPPMPDRESEYPALPPVRVRPCAPSCRVRGVRVAETSFHLAVHCRTAVLVAPGSDPAQAWARYHEDRTRLTRSQVAEAWLVGLISRAIHAERVAVHR